MLLRYGDEMRVLRTPRWRAQRALMRLTADARTEPNFLLIGAPQSGTTSLFAYLAAVPGVLPGLAKELFFFDRSHARGRRWYRSFFPLRATAALARARVGAEPAIGEGTPTYLWHPQVPARVHAFEPRMRLIALLRDPVYRAYSEFSKKRGRLEQGVSFEEAVELEEQRIAANREWLRTDPNALFSYDMPYQRYAYVDKGRYADHLERWLALFPREQLLVLTTDELERDPAATVAAACRFLRIPEGGSRVVYPRRNTRDYEPLPEEARLRLAERFAEPNRRLYELLGRDLGWTRPR
jgi:hypothetical protein